MSAGHNGRRGRKKSRNAAKSVIVSRWVPVVVVVVALALYGCDQKRYHRAARTQCNRVFLAVPVVVVVSCVDARGLLFHCRRENAKTPQVTKTNARLWGSRRDERHSSPPSRDRGGSNKRSEAIIYARGPGIDLAPKEQQRILPASPRKVPVQRTGPSSVDVCVSSAIIIIIIRRRLCAHHQQKKVDFHGEKIPLLAPSAKFRNHPPHRVRNMPRSDRLPPVPRINAYHFCVLASL